MISETNLQFEISLMVVVVAREVVEAVEVIEEGEAEATFF